METRDVPKLRPLGIGELLDQAIRIYRRNFVKFIAIIAVVQIPVNLLGMLFSLLTVESTVQLQNPAAYSTDNPFEMLGPGYFAGVGGGCLLAIVSLILIQGIATAALTRAVTDHYMGESVGIVDAYRKVGRSWLRLVGALLLAGILNLGLLIWFIVPCIGWVTGLGMLTFSSSVIIPLIAPIVVLEGQGAGHATRRAWDLSRRRFWWVVGFVALLMLFNQIIVTGPATLINVVLQFLTADMLMSGDMTTVLIIQTTVQSLVTLVFSLIYVPLQLTCMTLLYFDLRVRTEGFDLALAAEGALGEPVEIAEVVAQAPPPETTSLITGTELGYFVLVSLGMAGVVAIFMAFGAVVGLAAGGAGMLGP
ncbi:MAG: hypothetical protein GY832_27025 [Chloroflexi bacterium]|nr:hypothetical protein [Chloroflexota bacterium]